MLPVRADLTGVYRLTGRPIGTRVVSSVAGIAFSGISLYTAHPAGPLSAVATVAPAAH
jgi:hypothetical protein